MNHLLFLLFIFIVIFYYLFNNFNLKENFDIVGYNNDNDNIPKYNIDTTYSEQTKLIEKSLTTANNLNKYFNDKNIDKIQDELIKEKYMLYNKNIDFPPSKIFKDIIKNYLINNKIFGKNVYISSDILEMYTKDV